MYELIATHGNTWYIQSPSQIGLFQINDHEVILIDSGNDKEAARKILSVLQACNWNLKLIINTHSNADHIGGNAYLQEKTGCRIAATHAEAAFIVDPWLEASFLLGAYPPAPLRNKFLLAQPSHVTDVITSGLILDTPLQAVSLTGHFMGMIGIMTPDKVFFVADSIFSADILRKYHVTFMYDVKKFLETLDLLAKTEAALFIPSHAAPTENIAQLVQINKEKIAEIIDLVLKNCATPINFEVLLKNVCDHYGLRLDFNQYVLVGSTIKSYLSYLYDLNQIEVLFEHNTLLWLTK